MEKEFRIQDEALPVANVDSELMKIDYIFWLTKQKE